MTILKKPLSEKEEEEEKKKKLFWFVPHPTLDQPNPTQSNLTNLSIYQQERDKSSTRRLSKIKIKKWYVHYQLNFINFSSSLIINQTNTPL